MDAYYDAVVLGTDLAPATAAALLARRGYRVLVLGEDAPRLTYRVGDLPLARTASGPLRAQSALVERVFAELAIPPHVAPVEKHDRAFTLALPDRRIDFSPGDDSLERSFGPHAHEDVSALAAFRAKNMAALATFDDVVASGALLASAGLLARARLSRTLRRSELGSDATPALEALPPLAAMTVRAELAASDGMANRRRSRLRIAAHDIGWAHGTRAGARLSAALLERARAYGAEIRQNDHVRAIGISAGRIESIEVREGGSIGAGTLILGHDIPRLARLFPASFRAAVLDATREPEPRWARAMASVVVPKDHTPAALGPHTFFVTDPKRRFELDNFVHIEREPVMSESLGPCDVLRATMRVPVGLVPTDRIEVRRLRVTLLRALAEVVPFVGRHAACVDAPFDPMPGENVLTGMPATIDDPARGPTTMPVISAYAGGGVLGVEGIPVVLGSPHVIAATGATFPGLGCEGALLAGVIAADAARAPRRRDWLMRRRWGGSLAPRG